MKGGKRTNTEQKWIKGENPGIRRRRRRRRRRIRKKAPRAWMSVCCKCCVLSGRSLCDGLITGPEESYRVWCV
jgi:hypothetical protein